MAFGKEHELHGRRFGRNLGVGLCLLGFVAVVFGMTVAKVSSGDGTEAFDHVARPAMAVEDAE